VAIDRNELGEWLREQGYMLITREQAARAEQALDGVVLWDDHRRALAKADTELAELRARVEQLATTGLALLDALGDHGVPPVRGPVGPIAAAAAEFRAVLDGDATPADREDHDDGRG
jgi:hypothetical protein